MKPRICGSLWESWSSSSKFSASNRTCKTSSLFFGQTRVLNRHKRIFLSLSETFSSWRKNTLIQILKFPTKSTSKTWEKLTQNLVRFKVKDVLQLVKRNRSIQKTQTHQQKTIPEPETGNTELSSTGGLTRSKIDTQTTTQSASTALIRPWTSSSSKAP